MRELIDSDIRRAATLPSSFYTDRDRFDRVCDRVLARTWHVLDPAVGPDALPAGHARPLTLLEGALDEPVVLTRDAEGTCRLLSNVCTHRGMPVATDCGPARQLRCAYHGRRWDLCGHLRAAPGFAGAHDFPAPSDDLPQLPLDRFGPWWFASLDPLAPLHEMLAPLVARVGHLPLSEGRFDPDYARDYVLDASWIAWVDNYLEGFHVPFVHPRLARTLDSDAYRTECFDWGSVQIGVTGPDEPAFDLPPGHPDAGLRVGGLYFWLFPTTAINVYPWGISLNLVQPLGPERTRITYRGWVWDASARDRGPGADLHDVEAEDQAVVAAVQRGLRSRIYRRGRYAPEQERGVHHFHRLLCRTLDAPLPG